MTRIAHDWFSWPDGAVLTNLVASAIWVGFATWRIFKKLNVIHRHAEAAHAHARAAHDHVVANVPVKRPPKQRG